MKCEVIPSISATLQKAKIAGITQWNRLDFRPRSNDNFDQAIKAEVRDALWMLTKQWQMGEFNGDDAGSPVFAKIHSEDYLINKYKPGSHSVQRYIENDLPLESLVERISLPFNMSQTPILLNIRLIIGRQWLKLISIISENPEKLGKLKSLYIKQYLIDLPSGNISDQILLSPHKDSTNYIMAHHKRSLDGWKLLEQLLNNNHSYDQIDGVSLNDIFDDGTPIILNKINDLENKILDWYRNLFLQPEGKNQAWNPSSLEYQFSCSAKKGDIEKTMHAEEYYHGHLDWYNFDFVSNNLENPSQAVAANERDEIEVEKIITAPKTFIPSPIIFDGMPNTRWWTFEDSLTSFGDIKPDTTDINKLLIIEFGLQYANDWFLFPLPVNSGSINEIKGLTVTNSFGETIWIEPAQKVNPNWQMFNLKSIGNNKKLDTSFITILPTTLQIKEGKPLEEVAFIHDEIANMVWAVEKTITLPHGERKSGKEAALEVQSFLNIHHTPSIGSQVFETNAPVKYELMNTVPENWMPFIKVKTGLPNRKTQYQRASLPRLIQNLPEGLIPVRPRTTLVRENMDNAANNEGDESNNTQYFINDEEITRAGIIVKKSFQRTRWYNGKVCTWLGIRKIVGRGEGSSGLAFDQILPVK